jgi:hypothetical protein
MQIESGGSIYPVPRQGIEIPTFGLIDRATRANARRISALITNSSDAFISDTSDGVVCGG